MNNGTSNIFNKEKTNISSHISGTGVSADESEQALPALKGSLVLDGVGTPEHAAKTGKWFFLDFLAKWIEPLETSVFGYHKYDLDAQTAPLLKGFDKNLKGPFPEITHTGNILLSGHSRGVAGGMIGVLGALYQIGKSPEHTEIFKHIANQINIMNLVLFDGVAGPKGNYLYGVMDLPEFKDKEDKLGHLLRELNKMFAAAKREKGVEEKETLKVTIMLARTDSRPDFEIDPNIQAYMLEPGNSFELYRAGFQHSAMVDPIPYEKQPEGFKKLYPDERYTPTQLANSIIAEKKGLNPQISAREIATKVNEQEMKIIGLAKRKYSDNINLELSGDNELALDYLLWITSRDGYSLSSKVLTHTDFLAIIANSKDNPGNLPIYDSGRVLDVDYDKNPLRVFEPKCKTGFSAKKVIGRDSQTGSTLQPLKRRNSWQTPTIDPTAGSHKAKLQKPQKPQEQPRHARS
ncbi:hypothetical protein [Zobellia galactanivorans]|uniref:Uncharacterized protein n=1 Tax=Zobellia galactanivorans (strain DSM 12802 / CCUG 47099 / CIP 106680 / NCIMB 13871 / Dsij) TaxID=63186 RepID=G0L761_ZOBGA|nr:hypothetical protein [Zobellia galactanivorans]CAZ97192.1 Hypothetical protein ZOBELLIA_3053 [Zobellia galactanivorans]